MERRQNSILRNISDEKTMELIHLYEAEECLWNTTVNGYKNRQIRQQAAERIAKKLNIPHFTSRFVTIKFKNLRNSYCQELKKVACSISEGDDPVYKPKVFWFNQMDSFLCPHLQQQPNEVVKTLRSLHKEKIKQEPSGSDDAPVLPLETAFIEETACNSDNEELMVEEPLQKCSPTSSTASKRLGLDESEEIDLTEMIKDISSRLHVLTNQSEDCFESFGKYVSNMLRNMPVQHAVEVKPKIVSLLVAASLKTE